jgi:phosphatidylserine/phosphatidylglycerophosphate/cardiolipin synthase-like enzyme
MSKPPLSLSGSVALLVAMIIAMALVGSGDAQARRHRKTVMDAVTERIDRAMVAEPKDEDTCFSPDEPCDVKLLKFIDSAKTSIDVAIYDINLDELVHHLLVQSKKITVRIVCDQRQAKGDHSLIPTLIKAGASVRFGRQRGIMHNKFVVVDGRMVEIGSFNYTHHATQANQENQIYLAKPAVVDRYKKRFEKIWSTAKIATVDE